VTVVVISAYSNETHDSVNISIERLGLVSRPVVANFDNIEALAGQPGMQHRLGYLAQVTQRQQ